MARCIFITGTDTGIGKTFVACGLSRELVSRGFKVNVLKPVETGCKDRSGELVAEDAEKLWASSSRMQSQGSSCVYRLRVPAAPTVAAAKEALQISCKEIIERVEELSTACDFLIVEGAGGLFVPINREHTFLDLIQQIKADTLLVVGSRLGALNHAALSLHALKGSSANLLGYVLNNFQGQVSDYEQVALDTNREELRILASQFEASELGFICYSDESGFKTLSDKLVGILAQ